MAASLNDAMRYGNTVLPVCHIRKPSMLDMQGPAFLVKSGNRLFPITSRQRLDRHPGQKGMPIKRFPNAPFINQFGSVFVYYVRSVQFVRRKNTIKREKTADFSKNTDRRLADGRNQGRDLTALNSRQAIVTGP